MAGWVHARPGSCNVYCRGEEHMLLVEVGRPTPEVFMAMAASLGYRVVHAVPALEVDRGAFRRLQCCTYDLATNTWRPSAPQDSHNAMVMWRVHLAPAVLPGLAQGKDHQGPMPLSRRQRFARWCRSSWALVACCVVLMADLSHAQVMGGRIDAKQALTTAEYMTLFIKVNQLHSEFCRPPSASALPQTVQLCTDLAVLLESRGKPHEKGESCPAKP